MEIKLNMSEEQHRTLTEIVFKYVNVGGFADDLGVKISQKMRPIYFQLSVYFSKENDKKIEELEDKERMTAYNIPQQRNTVIEYIDPDAPKTVWLANNRSNEFYSPVFSSKEKCKVFCDKKNGFRTFSDESISFVVPIEVVVDAFNNWGDRVTLNEQIKEQMNEPK